jgi:hypothetical protein
LSHNGFGLRVPGDLSGTEPQEVVMLLVLALILLLVFGGLGFVAHVLWWGLILAVVIAVAHAITGRRV